MPVLRILHTNDLHGRLTGSRMPELLRARSQADLYFDTGDCIKAGNLAVPIHPDPVWPRLAEAKITASVPGNRESHVLEAVVRAKFQGSTHPILCANWRDRAGHLRFQESMVLAAQGVRIGVFGLMVPMVTERMVTKAGSQFLWEAPTAAAKRVVADLRPKCDLVIALTHIGHTQDIRLAEAIPDIDLIFGGHSHTVLDRPVQVNHTWIAQGGSHARFLGEYEFERGLLGGGLVPWVERT